MFKRKTKDEFVKDGNKIHNSFYDYSLINYKNNNIEIIIICPIHGKFKQRPFSHMKVVLNVKVFI